MNEIHALSGAYAVDALDERERVRFEEHLAVCADCRAEVDSLREAAGLLPESTATAPPPSLRDRVLADIATVRPLPPETPAPTPAPDDRTTSLDAARQRRRRRLPTLLAAAAVTAVLGAGAAIWEPWEQGQEQTQTVAQQVLAAADAEAVRHEFEGGATATVVRSASLGKAVITTSNMPAAPEGKVYQLWLQDPSGEMVPAGLMPPASDQTVVLEGDARTAKAVGITVEPDGGSPHPTTAPLAVFDLEQAT